MSSKLRKSGQVTACFFGDGASNEGTFHESLNIAGAFNLPIVYVCENNLYAVGTRQSDVRRVEDIADRAMGYGMPGVVVDGNDIIAVYEATHEAVARARAGEGPTLIECKTYRWRTHFEGEPDTYRPPAEVEAWLKREPIAPYRKLLIEREVVTSQQADAIEQSVLAELEEAVTYARQSPEPEPEAAMADLWA
jgi:pyruvate dehydrogenase E1 component alpha subunit